MDRVAELDALDKGRALETDRVDMREVGRDAESAEGMRGDAVTSVLTARRCRASASVDTALPREPGPVNDAATGTAAARTRTLGLRLAADVVRERTAPSLVNMHGARPRRNTVLETEASAASTSLTGVGIWCCCCGAPASAWSLSPCSLGSATGGPLVIGLLLLSYGSTILGERKTSSANFE